MNPSLLFLLLSLLTGAYAGVAKHTGSGFMFGLTVYTALITLDQMMKAN